MAERIDDMTSFTIGILRSWRDAAAALANSVHVEHGSSCDCCEEADAITAFITDDIERKLEDIGAWAEHHRDVYANAVVYALRMDLDAATFAGGCPLDHKDFTDRPTESLDELFGHWCIWIGAFWVGERADLYYHHDGLGGKHQITMRTSDEVKTYDLAYENFHDYEPHPDYSDGVVRQVEDSRADLAELLARSRRYMKNFEIEDFMDRWSGVKIPHWNRG